MTPHDINKLVHIAAGALALMVGLIPLLTVKGGPLHRRFGTIMVGLGGVNLAAAFVGVAFFNPPPALVAAFVAASYQYLSSLRALMARQGSGAVDFLLAAAGLAACGWLYVVMGPGTKAWTPAIGYSTIGYTAFLCLYDLSRPLWRKTWLTIRPLDHGLKMTGFYFAMASAGAGNLLRGYQPWSQVMPSLIGMIVMLLLAALWFARKDKPA